MNSKNATELNSQKKMIFQRVHQTYRLKTMSDYDTSGAVCRHFRFKNHRFAFVWCAFVYCCVHFSRKYSKKKFFSWQRHYLPFPTIGKAIFRWEERDFFIHRIKCDAIQNARTHTYPREQRVRCKGEKKKRARDSNLKLDEFQRWSVGVRLFIDKHAYTMCIRCVVYFAARVAHTDENDFKKNDWRWLMTISGDDNDLCVHCTGISFSRICVGIIDAVQQTQFRIYFGPVCVCICRVHTTKLDSIFFTLACATSPEMLKTKKKKTFWWKWI